MTRKQKILLFFATLTCFLTQQASIDLVMGRLQDFLPDKKEIPAALLLPPILMLEKKLLIFLENN